MAKGWLLALVAEAPLAQAGAVPAAELARAGPELCSAIVAALRSDADLDALVGAPLAASAGRLTGAGTPAQLTAGVEALRATIWRALRAGLRDARPDLVADLGDRLAHVCAKVAEVSLGERAVPPTSRGAGPLADVLGATAPEAPPAGAEPVPTPEAPAAEPPVAAPPAAAPGMPAAAPETPAAAPEAPAAAEPPAAAHASSPADVPPPPEPDADAPARAVHAPYPPTREPEIGDPPAGVLVVDLRASGELADDPLSTLAEEMADAPPAGVSFPRPLTPRVTPGAERGAVTRRRPVDTSWPDAAEAGPPWLAAITRRLQRHQQDGRPFGVLVIEVDDLDRLLASQSGREVAVALEQAERGLTAELRPADLVVRERLGRWWLTSPERDAGTVRDLGRRAASAISRAMLGGAALTVSVGVAVCPDDGATLEGLAGRAEEGMFAARAAGLPLAD